MALPHHPLSPFETHELIRDSDAPSGVKHLLHVMTTYANADGRCWPSLKRLAGDMGVSREAVRYRVQTAAREGWIVIDQKGRWKGSSARYRLTPKGPKVLNHDRKGVEPLPRTVQEQFSDTRRSPNGSGAVAAQRKRFSVYQRRTLAREIRQLQAEAINGGNRAAILPVLKTKWDEFTERFGHLYPTAMTGEIRDRRVLQAIGPTLDHAPSSPREIFRGDR